MVLVPRPEAALPLGAVPRVLRVEPESLPAASATARAHPTRAEGPQDLLLVVASLVPHSKPHLLKAAPQKSQVVWARQAAEPAAASPPELREPYSPGAPQVSRLPQKAQWGAELQ